MPRAECRERVEPRPSISVPGGRRGCQSPERWFADSPVEETGFKPSVPLGETRVGPLVRIECAGGFAKAGLISGTPNMANHL